MQICIVGAHTDVGKTHTSAMLCACLKYDYYKIIQAGEPKDSDFIRTFCPQTKVYPEGYVLKTPTSPHLAKKLENAQYNALALTLPKSQNLIIETAGGIFSPIDEKSTMIDFIKHHNLPVILVGRYYIGGINHILLSIKALKTEQISLKALIISGEQNQDFDDFITAYTGITPLHLPFYDQNCFADIQKVFLSELKKQQLQKVFI